MTKRKDETHAEYWVRRSNKPPKALVDLMKMHSQVVANQSQGDLIKKVAFLEGIIRKREADDREDQLRSSMKFKPLLMPAYKRRKGSSGTAMTIWSDWHWGETVDIRETGGRATTNTLARSCASSLPAPLRLSGWCRPVMASPPSGLST